MRSAYIPHDRVQLEFNDVSRTQQSMSDETDVNQIVARFRKTGLIDHVNRYQGNYSEMPTVTDFHEAMSLVAEASSMFEELPSELRDQFDNDAGRFLAFVEDPANADQLIELGLAERGAGADDPRNLHSDLFESEPTSAAAVAAPETPAEGPEAGAA